MKKVALLTHGIGTGGAERVVARLSKILREKCDLSLVLFDGSYLEYEVHCPVIDMKIPAENGFIKKIVLPVRRAVKLRKIKKEYEFDCVISFLDSPNIVNILAKTKNCKTAVSIRNYSDAGNQSGAIQKIQKFLIKCLYKRADTVIPVTKVIAQSYRKNYGISEKKLKVIYNPYNIDEICGLSKENLCDEHKAFFENGFIITSMGRFVYQKGFWHLIKAFSIAKKEIPELKLCIIGKGGKEENVKKLISDLDLTESVLLAGRQENPFKYIAKSDLYVLSSLFEGFPNALAEAMACKCPVIATDCKSGPREILYEAPAFDETCEDVTCADYGLLIPPLEGEEDWVCTNLTDGEKLLSSAITDMYKDEKKRILFAEKGYERVYSFGNKVCAEKYMEVFNK